MLFCDRKLLIRASDIILCHAERFPSCADIEHHIYRCHSLDSRIFFPKYFNILFFLFILAVGQLADVLKLSPEEFKNQFGVDKPKEDDQNIVFHCRSGVRSKNALLIARELGLPK